MRSSNDVSIIIPVIRPEKAQRCIDAINRHASGCEIIPLEDTERIGCPKMVEVLTGMARHDWVMFLGDDTIPQPGFLDAAVRAAETLPDGWGVVGLNTQPGNDRAHFMANKRMLAHIPGGAFMSTEYQHCFGDNELKDIAQEMGRWVFAEDAKLQHDHPLTGGEDDADYSRVYQQAVYNQDWLTYCRRKRQRYGGNKLAIGFPLVDPDVPVQFFTSFTCMDKPNEYTLLLPQFPHGPWTSDIAKARESLVTQALNEGCAWLLMLDTDQIYPPETLTKLMSHDVDVCGVRVHRRYPPWEPILKRGDIGKYLPVSEEEMFGGQLIEIDATGTGCLLFKMSVFERVPMPWFEFGMHNGNTVGEDINFCSKARQAGVRIFADTSIEVAHLTTMAVGRGMYQFYKKMMGGTANGQTSR